MKHQLLGEIIVTVMGVPVTVKGAIYYPPEPETGIDPPEDSMTEGGTVFVNGFDISEMFEYPENAQRLQRAIIQYVEE